MVSPIVKSPANHAADPGQAPLDFATSNRPAPLQLKLAAAPGRQAASRALPPGSAKRGWKVRFFRKLASAPAICLFATVIAPGLFIGARHGLVHHFPAAAKLYAAIGRPVNLDGLDLRAVSSVLKAENGGKYLLIKGEIVNLRNRTSKLPNLDLALRGGDGRNVYTWQAPSPTKRIKAHDSISFVARLDSPPEGAQDVLVRFARKGS